MQQKRIRALWSAITAITVVVTALVLGEPSADAAPRLPVTYNFLDGARAELAHPGGSLPGTNDFSCSPAPRHPRPVVLVHGSGGGRQTNWATMAPALANEGYCVFAPTYGTLSTQWPASALGGLGPKDDSAWQLKAFMSKVMTATHTDQIDIVGHSLGTEIPTYWMKYLGGRGHVAHYISLAPYWRQGPDDDDARGESIAEFRRALGIPAPTRPACPDCVAPPRQLDFNHAVRQPTPYLEGVRYTNIVTRFDDIVTPYWVGILPGGPRTSVRNIELQDGCDRDFADHLSIVSDRRAVAYVLNALDPAHPRPVPCAFVPPVTGG
ncbi:esterase/lipase family protein [Gordonia aichiensis]|uniref:Triacylglycerol lipase n=1 Tax=Gordonia aichiensis NBRC 108223 TaxID=1220583 RepID=L7KGR3_9ACTN|nr:alpha/beta fold hydrolase [Gordonia aichiensis]GAC47127.1 triacylglycerol lipase [Gordonia aichiensis NBRC 108223]